MAVPVLLPSPAAIGPISHPSVTLAPWQGRPASGPEHLTVLIGGGHLEMQLSFHVIRLACLSWGCWATCAPSRSSSNHP